MSSPSAATTTCGASWSISAREWSLKAPLATVAGARVTKAIRPPHDYGVAIVLLNVAEHVVPPEQLAPLREAVRRFLWASYLDRIDKPQAEREFAALRELARTLPEPAATLLGYVNNRDVAHLGPQLRPYIGFYCRRTGALAVTIASALCAGLPASRQRRQRHSSR